MSLYLSLLFAKVGCALRLEQNGGCCPFGTVSIVTNKLIGCQWDSITLQSGFRNAGNDDEMKFICM